MGIHSRKSRSLLKMSAIGKVAPSLMLLMCLVHSSYSFWANEWDGPLNFECKRGKAIQTIFSVHNNHKEDRRWHYGCSPDSKGVITDTCAWTRGHVNDWDDPLLYVCPGNGVITGFQSHHRNSKEDRIWKIKCCQLKAGINILLKNCNWEPYANDWDKQMYFRIEGRSAITGAFSVHDNHKEDRRWRFKVCEAESA